MRYRSHSYKTYIGTITPFLGVNYCNFQTPVIQSYDLNYTNDRGGGVGGGGGGCSVGQMKI